MNTRITLIRMLKQFIEDIHALQQQGAGYYSCIPLVTRYNKLLNQAAGLFSESGGLIGTFDEQPEKDPKDPSEKMKVVQGLRIEIGQLMSLLESLDEEAE